MSNPYGPPGQPQHWRPGPPPPPMWRPPAPKPPVSGTATAALVVAVASLPLGFFGLFWLPAAAAYGGPVLAISMIAAFVLTPQILGYVALQEVKQGKAHPVSRQRAILAMAISGLYLLLGLSIALTSLTGG